MESGKINLSIESDLRQVQHVGEAVRCLCTHLDLEAAKPSSVELAVVEAVNNSIEHAYAMKCGNTVDVSFEYDENCLQISIKDYGEPMPAKIIKMLANNDIKMPPDDVELDELPESGWGVQLLKTVCDTVSYSRFDRSNRLSLSFRRSSSKQPTSVA